MGLHEKVNLLVLVAGSLIVAVMLFAVVVVVEVVVEAVESRS